MMTIRPVRCFSFLFALATLSYLSIASASAGTQVFVLEPRNDFELESAPLSLPSILLIENASGAIHIVPGQGDRIRFRGTAKGKDPGVLEIEEVQPGKIRIAIRKKEDKKEAETSTPKPRRSLLERLTGVSTSISSVMKSGNISINVVNGSVTVTTDSFSADVVIEVPPQLLRSIKASSGFGNVRMERFSDSKLAEHRAVVLQSDSGDVSAEGVSAFDGIRIESKFGKVTSSHTSGNLVLSTDSGDVTVNDASAAHLVSLKTNFGKINAQGLTGEIQAKSDSGDIKIQGLDSKGTHSRFITNFGKIVGVDLNGAVLLKTDSGDIESTGGVGDIEAETNFGKVTIKGREGHIRAYTDSGDIRFDNPKSLSEHGETNFGKVIGKRCQEPIRNIGQESVKGSRPKVDDSRFNF